MSKHSIKNMAASVHVNNTMNHHKETNMPTVTANHIQIAYETFGNPEHPALLLIMGLSMQMIAWPEELCRSLADQGLYVIRFDNRDVGLSEKMEGQKSPHLGRVALRRWLGRSTSVPYTLEDMARDAVGLLDALSIAQAHIVGASMGGMIGQILAARYPTRVWSLTSIMSTSGKRRWSTPQFPILRHLFFHRPKSRAEEDYLPYALQLWRLLQSPAYPMSEEQVKDNILRAYRRCYYPQGLFRHLAAILANGDRTPLLRQIRVPTLVIHGTADRMVPLGGGKDTARQIAGARLHIVEGMGHNLPPGLLPDLSRWIGQHVRQGKG